MKIIIGEKFNKLTIIKEIEKRKKQRFIKCKCECGNEKDINLYLVRSGKTKSCGCLQKKSASDIGKKYGKNRKTHGMLGTKIYIIWYNIKARCDNKNDISYAHYGAKGITYDKKWKKFEEFYKDMGKSYEKHFSENNGDTSIERKENNLNYCKSNCKWATRNEQNYNRKNVIKYKGNSFKKNCEILGLKYITELWRYKKGKKTLEEIFNKL